MKCRKHHLWNEFNMDPQPDAAKSCCGYCLKCWTGFSISRRRRERANWSDAMNEPIPASVPADERGYTISPRDWQSTVASIVGGSVGAALFYLALWWLKGRHG